MWCRDLRKEARASTPDTDSSENVETVTVEADAAKKGEEAVIPKEEKV